MKTPHQLGLGYFALFFSVTCWARVTVTTHLTPAAVTDGQLPEGYQKILFHIAKGDEPRFFRLPQTPQDGDWVQFASSSDKGRYVLSDKLNLPLKQVQIQSCGYCTFRYDKATDRWAVNGSKVSFYTSIRNSVPTGSWNIAVYDIQPGDYHQRIGLPASAHDGDLLIVRSRSQRLSQIDPSSLLYASTAMIQAGDEYFLRYRAAQKKWAIEKSPERPIDLRTADARPSAPRSLALLTDDSWIPRIKLPAAAGDRDRIIVRSTTSKHALIHGAGIEEKGLLGLSQGQQYSFMYVAEDQRWVVMEAPDTIYTAASLKAGVMPAVSTPRTIYASDRRTFVPTVRLPAPEPWKNRGARIVFRGEAIDTFHVIAPRLDGTDAIYAVKTGETPSFINTGGVWSRETATVDLLGVYSDEAAADLGDELAKARLVEGVIATNHALENSGVNFRVRLVGTRRINAQSRWVDLDGALNYLNDSPQISKWRSKLKADLVYYEGAERTVSDDGEGDSCGVAYQGPLRFYSVAVGSVRCSTKTMRHEIGHLVGLNDTVLRDEGPGYPIANTVMAGEMSSNGSMPFFSTPNRYAQLDGMPMGLAGKFDDAGSLNAFSSIVVNHW